MKTIAIVDYDTGNLGSVANMLRKVGGNALVTRDPEALLQADKIVLPGVGAFDEAMGNLRKFGLHELLDDLVQIRKKPILGVCLGAQIMTQSSEEGAAPGFGWLDARLIKFRPEAGERLRVPHMGWNAVIPTFDGLAIFKDVPQPMRFYFVHSYHMVTDNPQIELARATYGRPFACVLGKGNVLAMQYHPEKSHKYGLQIYRNFVDHFESC